jgi:hypothetical protein
MIRSDVTEFRVFIIVGWSLNRNRFVVRPLQRFFCLLGCRSFRFIPSIPPFLGALVYFGLAEKNSVGSIFECIFTLTEGYNFF